MSTPRITTDADETMPLDMVPEEARYRVAEKKLWRLRSTLENDLRVAADYLDELDRHEAWRLFKCGSMAEFVEQRGLRLDDEMLDRIRSVISSRQAGSVQTDIVSLNPASADPPPRVIHWRDRERHDRVSYVGRAAPRQGLAASPFGNPFRVDVDGTRAEVIEKYREWILTRPELLARLHELRGSVLACWCSPEACHADVLTELVDADETIEELLAAGVRPEAAGDRLRLHPADSGGIVPPELVERARSHKAAVLSLLAARQRIEPEKLWRDAIDRLAAEGVIPPELVDECKAARVQYG